MSQMRASVVIYLHGFLLLCEMFHMLNSQTMCDNHDLKNAILEQKLLESIRPALLDLIKMQQKIFKDQFQQILNQEIDVLLHAQKENMDLYQNLKENLTILTNECKRDLDGRNRHSKQPQNTSVLLTDFHLFMDETTFNPRTHLSRDRKTLFNSNQSWVDLGNNIPYDWPVQDSNLKNYYGVIGSLPIKVRDVVCYEVDAFYSIQFDLTRQKLLFEIGVARRSIIDNSHYIGWQPELAWSFSVSRDNSTGLAKRACETSLQMSNQVFVGNTTSGAKNIMYLGVRVNTVDRSILVVDRIANQVFCHFKNIDVTGDLWPVFGVYARSSADVLLTIRHSFLMTSHTWVNL